MRAALYLRLSEEDKDKPSEEVESESIKNQRSLLMEYARRQGWEVAAIYSDEDYSGMDRNRPGFQELLCGAKAGAFQVILCKTLSRFTRDLEVIEEYLHGWLPLWGVRFISVVDGVDTDQRQSKKARQIGGLVNQWYLEDLSDNIRSVLDEKRRAGKYIGATPLYGYQKDPEDHNHLIPDAESAAVVHRIFTACAAGRTVPEITRGLNREGVENPTWYKYRKGWRGRPGCRREWSENTVRELLRNPMYTGVLLQGQNTRVSIKEKRLVKTRPQQWFTVEGAHAPLVDKALFEAAASHMGGRQRCQTGGYRSALFSIIRCGRCGGQLRKNSAKGHPYIRCPKCGGPGIRLDQLEMEAWRSFSRRILPPGLVEMAKDAAREETEKREKAAHAAVIKALSLLYEDRAAGRLEEAEFLALQKELEKGKPLANGKDAIGEKLDLTWWNAPLVHTFLDRVEVRGEGGRVEVALFYKV